jgi:TPR repeat protein
LDGNTFRDQDDVLIKFVYILLCAAVLSYTTVFAAQVYTLPEQANQSDMLAYLEGKGVPKNPSQAFVWYLKAAEQGDAGGQNYLGMMYENGLGVERDYQQALNWYKKSASQDSPTTEKIAAAEIKAEPEPDKAEPAAELQAEAEIEPAEPAEETETAEITVEPEPEKAEPAAELQAEARLRSNRLQLKSPKKLKQKAP